MKLHLERKYEIVQTKKYIEILENGESILYQSKDDSYKYTRDNNGNKLTYQNSNGDSFEWTYDDNGNKLTCTENGVLIIDNRPKVTLVLTQEQIKKAKELGWL